MTYRERREARAERLSDWADKRTSAAVQQLNSQPELRHDWAFITQPGRIPQRDRMNRADARAFESLHKAEDMARRAETITEQLDASIYSDDPDAIERLEERVAELEAKREAIKAENKARRARGEEIAPAYVLANLSGNIKRNRDRLAGLKADKARAERSEGAGGQLVEVLASGYCSVTFAEKPPRETLDALKAAGFHWRRGSWWGKHAQLPEALGGKPAETWHAPNIDLVNGY